MATLSQWLDETRTSASDVARQLGVHVSAVYRWRDGIKVPRPEQVASLERLTGGAVTASDHQAAFVARQRSLMGEDWASQRRERRAPAHAVPAE